MPAFPSISRTKIAILFCLLTGAVFTASVIPFMGYFVVESLGEEPWKFSLYPVISAIVLILANRTFGERVDRGARPYPLVLAATLCAITGLVVLNLFPVYWVVVTVFAACMGLSNTATTTLYGLGRLYVTTAEGGVQDGLRRYNAHLRMMTSLGWMLGPPALFLIADQWGDMAVFRVALGIALFWLVCGWFLLPRDFHGPRTKRESPKADANSDPSRALWAAALVCFLFALAHILSSFSLPVYYTAEVGLPLYTPGLSFSMKCAMELVAIALSPWVMARMGKRGALFLAAGLGLVTYVLFYFVDALWMAVLAAVIEGTYYGLFASVGMSFVQEIAKGRTGRATSLYMNSLHFGSMLGYLAMGVIATAADFRSVMPFAFACLVCAILALIATRAPMDAEDSVAGLGGADVLGEENT